MNEQTSEKEADEQTLLRLIKNWHQTSPAEENKNQKDFPKISDKSQRVLYSIAHSSYVSGKYAEASEIFRFLCLIEADSKKHWMGLGASLQMQASYDEALQPYSLAACIDPQDPSPHFYAAECLFAMKQYQESCKALAIAQELINHSTQYQFLTAKIRTLQELLANKTPR